MAGKKKPERKETPIADNRRWAEAERMIASNQASDFFEKIEQIRGVLARASESLAEIAVYPDDGALCHIAYAAEVASVLRNMNSAIDLSSLTRLAGRIGERRMKALNYDLSAANMFAAGVRDED